MVRVGKGTTARTQALQTCFCESKTEINYRIYLCSTNELHGNFVCLFVGWLVLQLNIILKAMVKSWRSVTHLCVSCFFSTINDTISFQSHRLLFSHTSEVRGTKSKEIKFASSWYRTHNIQVKVRYATFRATRRFLNLCTKINEGMWEINDDKILRYSITIEIVPSLRFPMTVYNIENSKFGYIITVYFMLSGRISRNIGENIFGSYTGTTSENTKFHVLVA